MTRGGGREWAGSSVGVGKSEVCHFAIVSSVVALQASTTARRESTIEHNTRQQRQTSGTGSGSGSSSDKAQDKSQRTADRRQQTHLSCSRTEQNSTNQSMMGE